MVIFFNFQTTSNHLYSLQVENCDSNSRLVVDEDVYSELRLERVKALKYLKINQETPNVGPRAERLPPSKCQLLSHF